MNSETPKVQVVIDKEYYDRLVENQKTPQQAREFLNRVVSILRQFKGTKLWSHSEMADFLERQIERTDFSGPTPTP